MLVYQRVITQKKCWLFPRIALGKKNMLCPKKKWQSHARCPNEEHFLLMISRAEMHINNLCTIITISIIIIVIVITKIYN
jgi:hypothetical protein